MKLIAVEEFCETYILINNEVRYCKSLFRIFQSG